MPSRRTLGPALVTVVGALTIFAAPALAESEFAAEEFPALIGGQQTGNHVITIEDEKNLTCEKVTFTGQATEPSEDLTVIPSYTGCTAFGFSATVAINECAYKFHTGTEAGEEGSELAFKGAMEIDCPPEKKIVVTVLTCQVKVGDQNDLGVEFVNNPAAEPQPTVTANISTSELEYEKSVDGAFCPLTGTGVKENGIYSGSEVISASKDSEPKAFQDKKRKPTKLCKEEPPCANIYDKPAIAATKKGPILLDFEGEDLIECAKSQISANAKEKENAPLHLEKFAVTFADCKVDAACTKVEMTTQPTADLYAFADGGFGNIMVMVTLYVECAGRTCEYKSKDAPMGMFFKGGDPAEITFSNQIIPKKTLGGEKNCTDFLIWDGSYTVTAPKPVWPSR
jgi:hypothetical protein